ncbi:MAG: TspO/MBR family protein [Hyphomicrobium sp.]
MTQYVPLAAFIGLVCFAAVTGALFSTGTWYEALNKPWWTPPNWLFSIVWPVLYIMIAVGGWRVWKVEGIGPAVAVWGIGLTLNAAWSWIMFGEHQIGWALADLIAMWISIAVFIWIAWPLDRTAACLFLPYLIWAGYAGALNLNIWQNNP